MIGRFTLIFSLFTFLISPVALAATGDFLPASNSYLVQYKNQTSPRAIILNSRQLKKLQADKRVDYIEPNFTYSASAFPSDYYFNNQWYLKRIRADKAWTVAHDSPDIVIAVIDSGVQINHPDLRSNIWINKKEIPGNGLDDDKDGFVDDINGWDFVNNVADPSPKFKLGYTDDGVVHGTVVAGVLAASGNNNSGVAGITWQAQIMALKALDDRGVTDTVKVVNAINYAINQKVNIINLSFIGPNYSRSLEEAIRRAHQAGIIVVAAGGNDLGKGFGQSLDDRPMYPVCLDGTAGENLVIGVAATDAVDKKTNFSGFGKCIDIAAPGISIFSTTVYSPSHNKTGSDFTDFYDGYWSGTSLAVPMVSGALALIEQTNPSLTPQQVTQILLASADKTTLINDAYANQVGSGRLNVYAAVSGAIAASSQNKSDLLLAEKNGLLHQLSLSATSKKISELKITERNWSLLALDHNFVVASKNKLKIFNQSGELIKEFAPFEDASVSSLSLAVANINDDSQSELIVAVNSKGQKPELRIFNQQGKLLTKILAYSADFRGGVNLAAGDLDNTGRAQIVTVPASLGSAHVRVFNASGKLLSQFMAENSALTGNFKVVVTNIYSSLKTEARIIFYYSDGSAPYLKIFNKDGILRRRFTISEAKRVSALSVAVGDLDNDGRAEIACLVTDNKGSRLMIHRDNGILFKTLTVDSKLISNINNLTTIKNIP